MDIEHDRAQLPDYAVYGAVRKIELPHEREQEVHSRREAEVIVILAHKAALFHKQQFRK